MKRIYLKTKEYFKKLKWYDWIRNIIWLILIVLSIVWSWFVWVLLIGVVIAIIVVNFSNNKLVKRAKGNGTIYGLRRKGKGLLLNQIIKKDKTKPFVNVPYFETLDRKRKVIIDGYTLREKPYKKGDYYHTELLDVENYMKSIDPITLEMIINGLDVKIKKNDIYEGRNVYIDDTAVYFANWADSLLKKKYDSMPILLAINGHLYGHYTGITTQDGERPYKILKELQGDYSIKARFTVGFGDLWKCVPILNKFVFTRYVWSEEPKSKDKLPFKAIGAVNETVKHGYLTAGQATKEVYEAENGKIKYGFVLQLKKSLGYDTRVFHKLIYGVKSPNEKELEELKEKYELFSEKDLRKLRKKR